MSKAAILTKLEDDIAREYYGKSYDELDDDERGDVTEMAYDEYDSLYE